MTAPACPAASIGTHPLINLAITVELTLKSKLSKQLVEHAERLSREPVVLLADIIERVLIDDLVDAVLDEPVVRARAFRSQSEQAS